MMAPDRRAFNACGALIFNVFLYLQVEVCHGDELEVYVHPDGILPTILFLRDHHYSQFLNLSDLTCVDVPTRPYRFEVKFNSFNNMMKP